MTKSTDTFSLNSPFESEVEKYTIAVTILELYHSNSNTDEHNNIFTIHTPGYGQDPDTNEKLEEIIGQRNSNQIKLHVEEVNKKGLEIK